MGQEGLDSGYRVLSKKAILYSEIGLGACGNAWSLPAMLVCYRRFCNRAQGCNSSCIEKWYKQGFPLTGFSKLD